MSVDSGNTLEFNGRRRYLSALAGHSCRLSASYHFSPVAQLVEQAAVNRLVVGSSPTGGAFQSGANYRYPLVDTKRRARECPAFFHARRQTRGIQRFCGFVAIACTPPVDSLVRPAVLNTTTFGTFGREYSPLGSQLVITMPRRQLAC